MNKTSIIEKYIALLGNDCLIAKQNGDRINTKCIITQLWKQNKTNFEAEHTEIGRAIDDYYKLILPSSCDMSNVDENDTIYINGKAYYFIKHEPIYVSNVLHYYYCIISDVYEEGDYVFI